MGGIEMAAAKKTKGDIIREGAADAAQAEVTKKDGDLEGTTFRVGKDVSLVGAGGKTHRV